MHLGITLYDIFKIYLGLLAICLACIAFYEEATVKGTKFNKFIRHHFGLRFFTEFSAENNDLMSFDTEVPICDYETMTSKEFFNEHVAKYRPCLFKNYAKIWPAYHKWKNETYLIESAGDEIIYAER